MGILDFIASLAKSLAWPMVVLVGLIMFYRPISKRIHAIKDLSYKDAKISFEEARREVQAAIAVEKIGQVEKLRRPDTDGTLERRDYSNLDRLVFAWSKLIEALRGKLAKDGHDAQSLTDAKLLEWAVDEKVLTPEQFKALNGLRTMRNLALHQPDREPLSDQRYEEFMTLLEAMAAVLDLRVPSFR